MDIAVNAIIGALILLTLGWLKSDIGRLSNRVEVLTDRISTSTTELSERIARIEGRLDEREHH